MLTSVPGALGEVCVSYWPVSDKRNKQSTEWQAVDSQRNFTRQFALSNLCSGVRYSVRAEGRLVGGKDSVCVVDGSFVTASDAANSAPVHFAVVTGQDYVRRDTEDGHQVYTVMKDLQPDFFVHTGDIEYYDKPWPFADTVELARLKWDRIYALPTLRSFHNVTASYFMKDDHDTLKNDCWPGQSYGNITWEQGLSLFREQLPLGEKPYRTFRWGKDLQIWLVEGREFRSPNRSPDGPDKTIWGKEQKQWFFDRVEQSDATFRLLISPTPVVGPDRGRKNDSHANKGFTHEGDEIRNFISQQRIWLSSAEIATGSMFP